MLPIVPMMQLLNLLGKVDGRKKFHKLVYILKTLGAPFQERFEYSLFGVFSDELRGEVASLQSDGLIEEKVVRQTVQVHKTESLSSLLKEYKLDDEQRWFVLARKLNRFNARQLEGISTVIFLETREFIKAEQRKTRLLELKPHLSDIADECVKEAEHFLAERISA